MSSNKNNKPARVGEDLEGNKTRTCKAKQHYKLVHFKWTTRKQKPQWSKPPTSSLWWMTPSLEHTTTSNPTPAKGINFKKNTHQREPYQNKLATDPSSCCGRAGEAGMLTVAEIQGGKKTKQNQSSPTPQKTPKKTKQKKPQLLKTLEETSPKTLKEKRFQTAWTTGRGLRNSFSKNTCVCCDFGYLHAA